MKHIKLLIIVVLVATVIFFGFSRLKRFLEIDSCLDKGGSWNYELKKCEFCCELENIEIKKLYWYTEYDSIKNQEFLVKGNQIDSCCLTLPQTIEILNKRKTDCKLELSNLIKDTIVVKIINDEYLTERMGSTGAFCYLAETVYTLTDEENYKYIKIEMEYGSHASPGVYSRKDFKILTKE
ncbi:hypothetical protein CYCD_11940 [Tenuifilaceae bacterium CYCD]|nr:hypothetical protein CYCD_11620 [Tenuifilaceae bacterium CYCD]BDX37839.1 hypothetical protein CYCD_11940 [Tenuifilaceae bacterium CYCD]